MTGFYRSRAALSRIARRCGGTFGGRLAGITIGSKFVGYLIVIPAFILATIAIKNTKVGAS